MTIVVFAIMLTERLVGERITQTSRYIVNGAIVAAAVFVGIVGFLLQAPPVGPRGRARPADTTAAIGRALRRPVRRHASSCWACSWSPRSSAPSTSRASDD